MTLDDWRDADEQRWLEIQELKARNMELENAIREHKQGIETRYAALFKKIAHEDKLLWAVLGEDDE